MPTLHTLADLRRQLAGLSHRPAAQNAELVGFGVTLLDAQLGGGIERAGLHELLADGVADQPAAVAVAMGLVARAAGERPVLWVRQDAQGMAVGRPHPPGLAELGLEVIGSSEPATGVDAVYTGWHRDFVFTDLEAACDDIWAGARLVTASNVPFFATATGRAIGASYPINAMIRSLTAKRPLILGKPSRISFVEAARAMGLKPKDHAGVIVVGDDPALEMRMASNAGAVSIGLTTGMLTREMLPDLAVAERPHVLLDSLSPLLTALT